MAQARCIVAPRFHTNMISSLGKKGRVESLESVTAGCLDAPIDPLLLLVLVVVKEKNDEDDDEPVLPLPAEEDRGKPEVKALTAPWLVPVGQLCATFS